MPKYVDLAHELEQLIHSGRWNQGVPSVRELAFEHGVSLVTVSRAMQVLCDKKLLRSIDRSGYYLIGSTRKLQSWALLLRLTPGPWMYPLAQMITGAYERLGRAEHCQFLGDSITLAENATPSQVHRQLVEAKIAGIGGVFLLPSRASEEGLRHDKMLLQGCKKAELPVVLLERGLRGQDYLDAWDLVCASDFEAGRQCTRHLLDLHRRRIAFIQGSPVSSHHRRMAGYLFELHQFNQTTPSKQVTPLIVDAREGLTKRDSYHDIADQLIAEKADGVVCYQDYVALGLILECLVRKIAVPKDIAVVGFDNLPVGNAYSMGITTFDFNEDEMARHALACMRDRLLHPDRPPIRVEVPGKLIVRESSVAP